MLTIRKSEDRGRGRTEWLNSRHTFSFAEYHDPRQMGFRSLRVINEDRVTPGAGFPPHGHRDMEILSYVIDGALEHKDSLGNGSIIRPGDIQRMSAGTGVRHSEFNASATEPVHFLQIWILPEHAGLPAGYEQKPIAFDAHPNAFILIASPPGEGGAVDLHQDARLYAARLIEGAVATKPLAPGRFGWVQVVRGNVTVNGEALDAGDGARLENETSVTVQAGSDAEVLLFDLG